MNKGKESGGRLLVKKKTRQFHFFFHFSNSARARGGCGGWARSPLPTHVPPPPHTHARARVRRVRITMRGAAPPRPPNAGDPAAAAGAGHRPPAPSSQLAEVLDLCRGPTDERRLVGLLLATKLLPALAAASGGGGGGSERGGGADAPAAQTPPLRAVCDAVGLQFMERLLLPLSQPAGGDVEVGCGGEEREARARPGGRKKLDLLIISPPLSQPDPDHALKDAGGCALAVAVLSAFVRLPDVAAHPTVVGLAPVLVKVRAFFLLVHPSPPSTPASKVESCVPVGFCVLLGQGGQGCAWEPRWLRVRVRVVVRCVCVLRAVSVGA